MSKHLSKEKTETQTLKEDIQRLTQQLNMVSSQALQLQTAAMNNEIILNRTLRFLTGKLLQLKKGNGSIDELIEYLNRVEDEKNVDNQPVPEN